MAGKFGRKAPYALDDPAHKRIFMDDFFETGLAYYTPSVDRATKVADWPMFLNGPDPAAPEEIPDGIGDCTIAAPGHQVQAWTAYAGNEFTMDDSAILKAYEDVGGYVLGDESTDNGCVIQDVLSYWQKTGIGEHQIVAYGQLRRTAAADLNAALNVFGAVLLGINCPESAEQQFDEGEPWTYVPGSPIAGGHAITLQRCHPGLDSMDVVTWGALQLMDRQFASEYIEEAWVVITHDWIEANSRTPSALDKQQLGQEFTSITGKPSPF